MAGYSDGSADQAKAQVGTMPETVNVTVEVAPRECRPRSRQASGG